MIYDFLSSVFHHQKFYLTLPWRLWDCHPFFLYGLTWFCGLLFALRSPWALLPFCLLALSAYTRLVPLVLLFLLPIPLLQHFYPQHDENQGPFHITHFHYNHVWVYKGKFNGSHITITTPTYYPPHRNYWVQGKWQDPLRFQAHGWRPLPYTYSLAAWHHTLHNQFFKRFEHQDTSAFLRGLLTENCDSHLLKKRLQKLGLSTLFNLSGFYGLAIGIMIAQVLFRIMERHHALLCLIALSTLWYLATAPSSSLIWIGTLIYLLTTLCKKTISWMNAGGMTLLIGLSLDPWGSLNRTVHDALLVVLGASLLTVAYPRAWEYSKKLKAVLLSALYITLCMAPYELYHEHVFYFHSLFYAVFLPILTSMALVILPLTSLCDAYVHLLLKLVAQPPLIGAGFYLEEMTDAQLCICLTGLTLLWLCTQENKINNV